MQYTVLKNVCNLTSLVCIKISADRDDAVTKSECTEAEVAF